MGPRSKPNIIDKKKCIHIPQFCIRTMHIWSRDNKSALAQVKAWCRQAASYYLKSEPMFRQERFKCWSTLGSLDQYAAQNSKYARPPIPSQPPTQKVFFQWHTQYDPTMKHSHWNCLCQGAVPMSVLWIGSLPLNSFNSPNCQTSWSH